MKKIIIIVSMLVLLCGCSANVYEGTNEDLNSNSAYLTYKNSSGEYVLSVTKDRKDFSSDCTFSVNGEEFTATLELENNKGTITFDGIQSLLGTDANMAVVYKDKCFYLTGGFVYSTDGESIDDSKSFWLKDEKLSLN